MSRALSPDLPVLAQREAILAAVRTQRRLVLAAPPGTGKSTQVPRWFLDDPDLQGRIVVLQPRRIAARSLAGHVAAALEEPVGQTVGYQVRFEGRSSERTRLLFQTYGVFFQQLQQDPLAQGVGLVVFDEFHERTLEADAVLAWIRRLQQTSRPDLALIVMSATLETAALLDYLDQPPQIEVVARTFPVDISHQPPQAHEPVWQQAARALRRLYSPQMDGSVLVFMPGVGEIKRTVEAVEPFCRQIGWPVHELHGAMDTHAQQLTLDAPQRTPCVIVATNVAETSLTIPGVRAVIDSGLARTGAYDAQRDLNQLHLGYISRQNATQRAGRAGRTGPGQCTRLWSAELDRSLLDTLAPEIQRLDLTGLALAVRALLDKAPDDPSTAGAELAWLTEPDADRWSKAQQVLVRIGAVGSDGRLGDVGRKLLRYPVHPALARVLLAASDAGIASLCAAMVAVMESPGRQGVADDGDLYRLGRDLLREPEARHWSRETREAFRQLLRLVKPSADDRQRCETTDPIDEADLRAAAARAWIVAYSDRIAVRLDKTNSFVLADGRKGALDSRSAPTDAQLMLALALHERGGTGQNRQVSIPVYLPVEVDWVQAAFAEACRWQTVSGWDDGRRRVVQEEQLQWRGLVLDRRPAGKPDALQAEYLLVEKLMSGDLVLASFNADVEQLVHRIRLAAKAYPDYGIPAMEADDWELIYHELAAGKTSLDELERASLLREIKQYVGPMLMEVIERGAPTSMILPSGRMAKLTYFADAPPEISARLGDFLGMQGRLTILDGRVDVIYDILAPNYRTVQKTADLTGFWQHTYPEVKKELKRRYPKHPWPDLP